MTGMGIPSLEWTALRSAQVGVYDVEVAVVGVNLGTTFPFQVVVVPGARRAFRTTEPNTYDPRIGGVGTLEHTILVWSNSTGAAALDKPILVVEGIDASNVNGPEVYYALGINPEAPLFTQAQSEGADIAVLDFGDGGRAMQANAAVVRQAVESVRQYNTDPRRSIDVIGVSMGGVVARYALAKMEQDRALYGVDRFVSVDAPQQGAVFQRSLQDYLKSKLAPADWPAGLARPAGRQLLVTIAR